MIPFAVYDLALKAAGVASWLGAPGLAGALDLMRSDLLFVVGYALLWVGLFALARRGPLRRVVVVLFHAATIVIVVVTTCANQYFRETGSTLDYGIIAYSLAEFEGIGSVIASEVTSPVGVLLSIALLYMIVGPWLVVRAIDLWRGRPPPDEMGDHSPESFGVCLLALVFGLLALLPGGGLASPGESFARDEFVNVVVTGIEETRTEELVLKPSIGPVPEDSPVGASLESTGRTEKRNVVLIHLESVRERSVTPYNEEIETTPYLDELAEESLLVERAYTTVPHTSKAITSVNCGVVPNLVVQITEAEPNGIPAQCLADLLGEQGYDSVLFQSATEEFEDRRELVENFGYEEFYPIEEMDREGFEEVNYFGYEDDIMLEPSREWLEEHRDRPFMATYLGVTGHHDYLPPARYGLVDFAEKDALNNYQNTVRYLDYFVRNVIEQYKEMGLYKDTIFVIYGDHGEGFGEHGLFQHDDTIYEEGLRVPLLIHDPKRFEGGERLEEPANHLDILPTVADLLGYEIVGGEYPGRSLLRPLPEDRTLMFSCYHEDRCLASLRGDEKYIYHYGDRPDELFDLSEDPLEEHNLARKHREEVKQRRKDVLAWRSRIDAVYGE
jgi:arylsulfatase A-like enzyme